MLLALLGVNVLAALVVRYPFPKRRIGFVVTHASVLLVLTGALVTKYFGVDGQVSIVEEQTVKNFGVDKETLVVLNEVDGTRSVVDLDADVFGGLVAVDRPTAPAARLGDLRVTVERYLPDSELSERIINDNPYPQAAVEVSLSSSGHDGSAWVFAGRSSKVGHLPVGFRLVADREELAHLLDPPPAETPTSMGIVKIEFEGSTFEIPVEECIDRPVPIGGTSRTVRVLRYLPHASVGPDNKVTSISNQPVNPAIEAELTGPDGSETRLAFAKFPDFQSMHGTPRNEEVKLTFITSAVSAPETPIEVLGGPDGDLYVRFSPSGVEITTQELGIGEPVDSPWAGRKFTVLRRFDHARIESFVEPVVPVRKSRIPAVLLTVSTPNSIDTTWVRKYRPHRVTMDGTLFELAYQNKSVPLGFSLTLNRFRIGYYPGENRPRSFESHVTITDPVTGRTLSRVISMNSPVKYGRYSLFQSSYRTIGERTMSVLGVSRDPGQAIVYTGYIGMMAGMLIILGTRITDRRRQRRS